MDRKLRPSRRCRKMLYAAMLELPTGKSLQGGRIMTCHPLNAGAVSTPVAHNKWNAQNGAESNGYRWVDS